MLSSETFNPASIISPTPGTTSVLSNNPSVDPYGNAWPKMESVPGFPVQDDSKAIFSSASNDTQLHNNYFDNPQRYEKKADCSKWSSIDSFVIEL